MSSAEPLDKFFDEPTNSHAKEAVLMHRLCFDLKVVAANHGYYLNTYWDDVDHDGFDLIFDDQYSLRKTQVKSVGKNAKTATWEIHKRILRPPIDQIDLLAFESSKDDDDGVAGGVVLMKYRVEGDGRLEVDYFYTDLYILLAFKHGLLRRKHKSSREAITKCLQKLCEGNGIQRLAVPLTAFVQAKSPATLLGLLSLRSTHGHNWKFDVIQLVRASHAGSQLPELKENFLPNFKVMVEDQDL